MLKLAYLASPYSHPDAQVRQQRYEDACEAAKAIALKGEFAVYSPIAHWHPIAVKFGMPTDAQFWKDQNEGVMMAADTIFILQLEGWITSIGVDMELQFAKQYNKNIIPVKPSSLGI